MTPEEQEELEYLAAQTRLAGEAYKTAIGARDAFMRTLDRRRRRLKDIASAAGVSEPQALRVVSREGKPE